MSRYYGLVKDGKIVKTGSSSELCELLSCHKSKISNCVRENEKVNGYDVVYLESKEKIYEYYAILNDEVIYNGTRDYIVKKIRCSSTNITEALRYGAKIKGYTIIRTLKSIDEITIVFDEKPIEKYFDKKLDYLERTLKEGNTCLNGKIKEEKVRYYMQMLKQKGINAKYTTKYDEDGKWYLIEVINGRTL